MNTSNPTRCLQLPFFALLGALSVLLLVLVTYAAPAQGQSFSSQASSSGVLIIVPGRLRENDQLLANIHNVTNTAFRYFQAHSYAPEDIYYLATDASLDADRDGLADVDAPATKANLKFAVTEWARHRLRPGQSVTLYMIGHGDQTRFYLNGMQGETVTPVEVDAWLDQLEAAVPGVQVTWVVDTCGAGAYINASSTTTPRGRVVVSATSLDGLAFASQSGSAFSDLFLDGIGQGKNLWDAFAEAGARVQAEHPNQIPRLDADGNGVPDEGTDRDIAAQRILLPGGVPPTPTPTPVPTLTPDLYEPDDSCEQVRALSTDGVPQFRSLHRPADADWVSLAFESGNWYLIRAVEDSPGIGVTLEIYDSCGSPGPGPFLSPKLVRQVGTELVWHATEDSTYYLKIASPSSTPGFTPQRYTLFARRLTYRVYLPRVEANEGSFH